LEEESDDIKRPEIEVAHALPQKLRSDWLTVVHAALRWILANDSVDDDLLLTVTMLDENREIPDQNIPLTEPAFLAPELTGGLGRRSWHKDERSKCNDECEKRLFVISFK
jgi:hypothetical protein